MRRYSNDSKLAGGMMRGTSKAAQRIRKAIENNTLRSRSEVLKQGGRLDQLAAIYLGDSKLWWVIAAASGIGWSLQLSPGTRIVVPTDRAKLSKMF